MEDENISLETNKITKITSTTGEFQLIIRNPVNEPITYSSVNQVLEFTPPLIINTEETCHIISEHDTGIEIT